MSYVLLAPDEFVVKPASAGDAEREEMEPAARNSSIPTSLPCVHCEGRMLYIVK
jgi:hypothetical protein